MADAPKSSPGGLAFAITLKPAEGTSPFANRENRSPRLKEEDVNLKLELAASRRLSFTAQKQVSAAATVRKVQDTYAKALEEVESKKKKCEEDLAKDLEEKEQKRQALIAESQQKLRAHLKRVDEVRHLLDSAKPQLVEKITQCLESAEERRKQQLRDMLEKIKEHEAHVQEVRRNAEEAGKNYDLEKCMSKMDATLRNREDQLNQLLERLREHNIRIENVRKNKQVLQQSQSEDNTN